MRQRDAAADVGHGERMKERLGAAGGIPETPARSAPTAGIGMPTMCSPEGTDRLTGDLERAGERVFGSGSIVPGGHGVARAEDSGP